MKNKILNLGYGRVKREVESFNNAVFTGAFDKNGKTYYTFEASDFAAKGIEILFETQYQSVVKYRGRGINSNEYTITLK